MSTRKSLTPSKTGMQAKVAKVKKEEWPDKIKKGHYYFFEMGVYLIEIAAIVGLVRELLRGFHN